MDFSYETCMDFGISLEKNKAAKIKRLLERLEEKTPYFSSTTLNFSNAGPKHKGSLIVRTRDKIFKSIKYGRDVLDLYLALEEDIEFQLSKWKSQRFREGVAV